MLRLLIVIVGVMMVVGAGVWAESGAVDANRALLGIPPNAARQEAACMASVPKNYISFEGLLDDPLCCSMMNDANGRQVCLQQSVDRINSIQLFLWNIYSAYRSDNLAEAAAKRYRGKACVNWSHHVEDKIASDVLTGKITNTPTEVYQLRVKAYLKSFPDYLSCLGYRDWSRDQGYID